jgi:methionyl-tRNA formyltransferase
MRIAYFGLPLGALYLERQGHFCALIALCRPEGGYRRLRARAADRVILKPTIDDAFREKVQQLKPDIIVSWFWTSALPDRLLRCAAHGGINAHPSLLPRWRGPDPVFAAIDAGDTATGVTIHRIEEGYDTGAIVAQVTHAISKNINAWQLARELDAISLPLLAKTLIDIDTGRAQVLLQDEAHATYAPAPTEDDLAIVWDQPTDAILRRIRAASPYPGAYTFFGDQPAVLTKATPTSALPSLFEPGQAIEREQRVCVATADGAIAIEQGRVIGDDDERWISGADWLALV